MGRGSRLPVDASQMLDSLLDEQPQDAPAWVRASEQTRRHQANLQNFARALADDRMEALEIDGLLWRPTMSAAQLRRCLTVGQLDRLTQYSFTAGGQGWQLQGTGDGLLLTLLERTANGALIRPGSALALDGTMLRRAGALVACSNINTIRLDKQLNGSAIKCERSQPLQLAFPGEDGFFSEEIEGVGPEVFARLLIAADNSGCLIDYAANPSQTLLLRTSFNRDRLERVWELELLRESDQSRRTMPLDRGQVNALRWQAQNLLSQ